MLTDQSAAGEGTVNRVNEEAQWVSALATQGPDGLSPLRARAWAATRVSLTPSNSTPYLTLNFTHVDNLYAFISEYRCQHTLRIVLTETE